MNLTPTSLVLHKNLVAPLYFAEITPAYSPFPIPFKNFPHKILIFAYLKKFTAEALDFGKQLFGNNFFWAHGRIRREAQRVDVKMPDGIWRALRLSVSATLR